MKTIILKDDLDKVMSVISRVVATRGQLPVLSNVLIKAEKNSIDFLATNLELGVSLTTGGKVLESGAITVPAKNLSEFVSLVRSGELSFEAVADKLKVTAGGSVATFAGIAASEFPSMPTVGEDVRKSNSVSLDKNKIEMIVKNVGYAASTDEARMVLTGVKFYKSDEKIKVVATDGFRLARLDLTEVEKGEKDVWPENLIIPAKTLDELARLVTDKRKGDVKMSVVKENNQVVFSGVDYVLISRILEGNFPETEKIIPIEFKTKVFVDRKFLIEAVRTAAIFARENSNIVRLGTTSDGIWVRAAGGQVGEEESRVEAEMEGDEVEIAFNFKYLLDTLTSMEGERVIIMANGRQSAVTFTIEGQEGLTALIMPVRI